MNENINIDEHQSYPDSNQKIEVPTMKVIPLKKICMTIGELPTSYLETMTYYEMLIWFINYLRDNIIPTVNGNAEAVQEVQNVVMQLQNYINNFKDSIDEDVEGLEDYMNNYFDNLDVQEEINNKLDQMLEDGVLEQIIEQYINSTAIWCFDTVADMKQATNLINGSYAKTTGYYSINDGGGSFYRITNTQSNNTYQEELNSGLYATLLYSDKINANQFGIIGNGVTDNTTLINDFLNYCMNHNVIAYFPDGTYIIHAEAITINMKTDKTLTIEGNYKSSIIKRISGTLGPTKWNRLLTFLTDENNTGNTGDIVIKNLMIDSNRRGQSNATDDYTYEFSADIFVRGSEVSNIPNFYADNLYCIDGVADHIDLSGSGSNYVQNVYINNFLAEDRRGTRNDIDFPGYCLGNIYISNSKAKRLHFEYNSQPINHSKVFVSDSEFDELELSGRIDIIANNLRVNKNFSTAYTIGLFDTCIFNLDGEYERSYTLNSQITFNNCEFKSHYTTLYPGSPPSNVSYLFIRDSSKINLNNCIFEYVDSNIISHIDGGNYFIFTRVTDNLESIININNTKFRGENIYAFLGYANNTFNVINSDFGNTDNFACRTVTGYTDLVINLDNIKLNPNKYFCYNYSNGVTLKGKNIICSDKSFYIDTTNTYFNNTTFDLHRKIYINNPLTTDYLTSLLKESTSFLAICKNDEFILNSSHNPHKWIAKDNICARVTGYSTAYDRNVNNYFNTISDNCRGASTERPTCYLSHGFEFYDETLTKPIYFDGTNWKDSAGSTV